MNIIEYLKNNILYLDGGMGTILQKMGLKPGESSADWNITHSDSISDIHKAYFDAGSNTVCTNTFEANTLKYSEQELEGIIKNAIEAAKTAREKSSGEQEKFIAFDIGPTGRMLAPYGDLDFEEAVGVFATSVKIALKYGVDLFVIETMNDSLETKAALLAVKENSDLPVFVTNAYSENDCLITGASPEAMVALLEGMGADAIGANCSFGPKQLGKVAERILKVASVPVILKPNAGLPKIVDGKTIFDVEPDEFSDDVKGFVEKGVRICGGCCGTTPDYIKALTEKCKGIKPVPVQEKNITVVSSYTHTVVFDKKPVLIGERINPTGKKRLKQALKDNDINYILDEGISQAKKGVHILDVNVGMPGIDEKQMLTNVVYNLQSVTDLPLQIDTADIGAMEKALRIYNGKALINSVNGKRESMEKVFPLVKKYGGAVIALTLDEDGIPEKAEDRVKIAEKILDTAKEYGIKESDIIFDALAMTVSADKYAAVNTLSALNIIKNKLKCHTSLGVSNVSFGLPNRNAINSCFFAAALENGLSTAIMNPYSEDMMRTYYSYMALHGLDENCEKYIKYMTDADAENQTSVKEEADTKSALKAAIVNGMKERAMQLTNEILKDTEPTLIIDELIVPALDKVGYDFEKKIAFLPQMLMSAEAAQSAFEAIKASMGGGQSKTKCAFVLATVKGDIHEIGKNIVKLLLENYGFEVIDLGKDVPPEIIADKVKETKAPLVGLSALMTTTVPAMEDTIKLLRKEAPWCKVVVGGAVLTEEYANKIGADKYSKDAMETVRYAEEIINNKEKK